MISKNTKNDFLKNTIAADQALTPNEESLRNHLTWKFNTARALDGWKKRVYG